VTCLAHGGDLSASNVKLLGRLMMGEITTKYAESAKREVEILFKDERDEHRAVAEGG
jgi:hypothetical protein